MRQLPWGIRLDLKATTGRRGKETGLPPTSAGGKAYAHRRTRWGDTGSLGRVRAGRDRGPARAARPLVGTRSRNTPMVRKSAFFALSLLLRGTGGPERLTLRYPTAFVARKSGTHKPTAKRLSHPSG
jgi:hypothetical protein